MLPIRDTRRRPATPRAPTMRVRGVGAGVFAMRVRGVGAGVFARSLG
ncbi:MAG: hypothetical protein PGN13_10425 [Patulibacter minatonensis]